jgi:hypothetical protein
MLSSTFKNYVMTRLEANKQILSLLTAYFEAYPDLRFGQGLSNLGIATHATRYVDNGFSGQDPVYRDIFYAESAETLDGLAERIAQSKSPA